MSPDLFIELRNGAIFYLILALSVTLHEFGHAKAADLVGDPLPRRQGRVTLNPLAHLDMFGTVLIPLTMIFVPIFLHGGMGFMLIGWGRPVQISLPHRETRRRDEILITIAGPIMNALIAFVVAVGVGLIARGNGDFANAVVPFGVQAIVLNACLIAFNLIPLPPLDGSRILRHVVGMSE
jgi:Zn-dependent protease